MNLRGGRHLAFVAALGVLVLSCGTAGAARTDDLFHPGAAVPVGVEPAAVVVGSLDGAVPAIAVAGPGEGGRRRVEIHTLRDGAWRSAAGVALGEAARFVDVLKAPGRDLVIAVSEGQIDALDAATSSWRPLLTVEAAPSAFGPGSRLQHVDVTRDLNDDGLDDVVLPEPGGFWISTQRADGSFSELELFGPPEPFRSDTPIGDSRSYGEVGLNADTAAAYQARLHCFDYDGDGRSDLVFWNEDHFDLHRQSADGRFSTVAEEVETEVPFAADGTYSLLFGHADRSVFALMLGLGKKTERTVLHSFRDMDGDGVQDLLTETVSGRSTLRGRSRYQVHYGVAGDGRTSFGSETAAIHPPERHPPGYSALRLEDLDGDGRIEVMVGGVKTGPVGMARALVGGSVAMDLAVYQAEAGHFPEKPTVRRKVRPHLQRLFRRHGVYFPTALLGDVDGDGREDLLVGKSRSLLHVYPGVAGGELFAKSPVPVAMALPDDERAVRMVDLDRDGKQDLLVRRSAGRGQDLLVTYLAR